MNAPLPDPLYVETPGSAFMAEPLRRRGATLRLCRFDPGGRLPVFFLNAEQARALREWLASSAVSEWLDGATP